MEHSKLSGNVYFADRFYKRPNFNPNYDKQLKEFEEWQSRCYKLLKDATKAANWFADVVRRDINPMFFATKGKFLDNFDRIADSVCALLKDFFDELTDN